MKKLIATAALLIASMAMSFGSILDWSEAKLDDTFKMIAKTDAKGIYYKDYESSGRDIKFSVAFDKKTNKQKCLLFIFKDGVDVDRYARLMAAKLFPSARFVAGATINTWVIKEGSFSNPKIIAVATYSEKTNVVYIFKR